MKIKNLNINWDKVKTYGMGHWVKFNGKDSDRASYLKNAQELSSLVKDTPWSTKSLASTHLSHGDFYVFVDNSNNPHIAVKMNGDEIDEVRGILNGHCQELEDDYRKVAISFLENNKEIKNGKEWLRKEEWIKRITNYIESIENETFTKEEVPKLIEDYFGDFEYMAYDRRENSNKVKLRNLLPRIKKYIAEYYNCTEDEIFLGDVGFCGSKHENMEVCPYKVILGDADFSCSNIKSLGGLKVICGDACFSSSLVQDLGNLTTIGGNADFIGSEVQSLGNLTTIGGDADFRYSQIQSLENLTTIGRNAALNHSKIQTLDNLRIIGGNVSFGGTQIKSLNNLTTIGGDADFRFSQIQSLENLTTIGRCAYFSYVKIKGFDNLERIGKGVFADDELMKLYHLEFDETGHRIKKENADKVLIR